VATDLSGGPDRLLESTASSTKSGHGDRRIELSIAMALSTGERPHTQAKP